MAEPSFIKRRLIDPLLGFLKQGVTPQQLALAVSMGIMIATVPVFGASTLLCLLVIWMFRLNPGAILFINQIAYPLQFVCYIPLIRAGEWMFQAPHIPLSIPKIFELFKNDLWGAIGTLWWSTMYALAVWLILAVPIILLLRSIFSRIFRRTKKSLGVAD